MSVTEEACQVCGRSDVEIVGVASVPAAPVSLLWCRECLDNNAQPIFCLEVHVCPCNPEGDPYYDESIEHGMEYAKKMGVKPWEHMADWYLKQTVWHDGKYIRIKDFLTELWEKTQ